VNFVHAAVEAVRSLLSDLDPDISIHEQPEFYTTALVLLSAPFCGPDTTDLAAFTGLPYSFIAPIRRRIIEAELWTDTQTCPATNGSWQTECYVSHVSGWMCW
jgi:hypothetical protein